MRTLIKNIPSHSRIYNMSVTSAEIKEYETLIASAPALLEALKDAYKYMINYDKCSNNSLLVDMKKAINLAKGA